MNREAALVSLILSTASLPALADDHNRVVIKDPAAIAAVVQSIEAAAPAMQQQWQEGEVRRVSAESAIAPDESSLRDLLIWLISDLWLSDDSDYEPTATGAPGVPTLGQLREKYRNLPQGELWNICLGRKSAYAHELGQYGACAMVNEPDPLRPVELPHELEGRPQPDETEPPR